MKFEVCPEVVHRVIPGNTDSNSCRISKISPLARRRSSAEDRRMARTRIVVPISLPPDMAAQLEQRRKEQYRSRSELVREALRRYFNRSDREQ
jgi:hypothetical protein